MKRVEIDLNVRVRGNWTLTGVEDVDGPVTAGDIVQVFEPESGLEGAGRVEEVDETRGLIFLSVDWASVREPDEAPLSPKEAAMFGIYISSTNEPGIAASGEPPRPTAVAAMSGVTCSA